MRWFTLLAGALFLCLAAAACGDEDQPQPSASATVSDTDEDTPDDRSENGSEDGSEETAEGTPPDTAASTDTPDTDNDSSGDVGNDQGLPTDDDASSNQPPDDSTDPGKSGESGDPSSFLPPAAAVAGSTASGYTTIEELIADRSERPPLLRCAAADDPSSLAISVGGQAAGRVFEYDDGLRTTTIQVWTYPTEAEAADAIRSIRELRCESVPIGPITIGAVIYEQSDSASEAPTQLGFDGDAGVDEATGASFERLLESADGSLIVQEELQFARLSSTVVFAGAREIRSPEAAPSPPVADSLRLARQTITAVAASLGRELATVDGFSSPATLAAGGNIPAGTFRATTTSFCLVNLEEADGRSAQVSWGAGEQAIVTIADTTDAVFGEGCGIWTAIDLEDPDLSSSLPAGGSGTLIVGTDIPAGTVVITSTGECTIDQLLGFSGAPTDLVASTILPPGESVEVAITTEAGIYLAAGCRY